MAETKTPTRGFVTIATGKEIFFRMAHTLLLSYRLASANPMPFAIMTDQRNRYTEDFDDVVILDDASGSYLDKLKLLIQAPYDETIFVDADCIAYGDLNRYWDGFEGATDFSSFGAVLPIGDKSAWFSKEGAGRYADQIDHLLYFHGGVYFIRRGATCERIYRQSLEIAEHYHEFQFRMFKHPADETILSLAMTLCGCVPAERAPWHFALYDISRFRHVDFFRRSLTYRKRDAKPGEGFTPCVLVHFKSRNYGCPMCFIEARKVHYESRNHRPWGALENLRNRLLWAGYGVYYFAFRVKRYLGRRGRRPSAAAFRRRT